jgi:hypothetical protein
VGPAAQGSAEGAESGVEDLGAWAFAPYVQPHPIDGKLEGLV